MKNVCIQGLGFVGSAMSAAVASATGNSGELLYNVCGVDLPNVAGQQRIDAINNGDFPFATSDISLTSAIKKSVENGI